MKTLRFKTNINCSGCINSVTPHLNQLEEIKGWKVDTASPDKVLTVETEDETLKADQITQVVEKAGFKIDSID
ncbi:MAG: cation transporter [Chitinophagales bacterium]|nr:cation transporter [Chitinophagales bacterium]